MSTVRSSSLYCCQGLWSRPVSCLPRTPTNTEHAPNRLQLRPVVKQIQLCLCTPAAGNYEAANAIHAAVPAEGLQATWRASRSRLDALNRTLQATYKPELFMDRLDALLMEMKNARTIAEHLKAEHAHPACRAAAAQVAEEARKYEAYILGSRSLYNRLVNIHSQRLEKLAAMHDSGDEVR